MQEYKSNEIIHIKFVGGGQGDSIHPCTVFMLANRVSVIFSTVIVILS